MNVRPLILTMLLATLPAFASLAAEPDEPSGLDPRASAALKRATDYLSNAKTLSVNALVTFDVFVTTGHKLEFEKDIELTLKRPNKVRAEVVTDLAHRHVYFDGKEVTVYNEDLNVYSKIPAPGSIDEMADALYEKFDIAMPIVDLIVADPYASYTSQATYSRYLGESNVSGELCDHVLLSNSEIDYQIWIATGDSPQVRKITIDYANEPGVPEYSVRFDEWEAGKPTSDAMFSFTAPEGADAIDALPVVVVVEEEGE